ncbi:MAG: DUF1816 domain-containing protein [Gloeocapsa sp. UFS-A4-WI-NPMV-4B04]|jgi:hypothetical protein|nr:DUF1816 domain-containing protein [Gloeocapsa sp. UFS-A4-WI-NPMV-4B04]
MNTLFSSQPTSAWWVEVSLFIPQQTYHLGPFNSREEAKLSRGTHVKDLLHQAPRDIVALIKQH